MTAPLVFISHSSHDADLAGLLSNFIREAFGLPYRDIRCTSVEEYQQLPGQDFWANLLDEVVAAKAFIVLVSEFSRNSHGVLLEVGARWGNKKEVLVCLAPQASADWIGGFLEKTHIPSTVTSRASLRKFVRRLNENEGLDLRDEDDYDKPLQAILDWVAAFVAEPLLPDGTEGGVISREDLRRCKKRLPGEVFATELLTRDVGLKRIDDHVVIGIDRGGVSDCVITNPGKSAKVAEFVTKENKNRLLTLDNEVQQFLVGKSDRSQVTIALEKHETRLRWASGGVLSIVDFRGRQWIPLFFRDIHPYGWNISLGQAERHFKPELAAYDLEQQLSQPWNYISREFLEETMVTDREPSPGETCHRRGFNLYANQPLVIEIADDFARRHEKYRRIEDEVEICDGVAAPLRPELFERILF